MMGEELNSSEVTQNGLLGDRIYALTDSFDGKIGSAKNPRKWPNLFDFQASYIDPPHTGLKMSPVRITLPDGTIVSSGQDDLNQVLSKALYREVTLNNTRSSHEKVIVNAEAYWPDMEHLDHRDAVTDFSLPEGTFFDCAVIHLVTTATLERLRELYPQGRFEARRFRPNIVVKPGAEKKDFIENDWIGRTLVIGNEVRLSITGACTRCVMITLPQGDLPADLGILRTAAKNNKANVGVYASVIHGGTIRRNDPVHLE
jgi:uncharacterized protein YcbX